MFVCGWLYRQLVSIGLSDVYACEHRVFLAFGRDPNCWAPKSGPSGADGQCRLSGHRSSRHPFLPANFFATVFFAEFVEFTLLRSPNAGFTGVHRANHADFAACRAFGQLGTGNTRNRAEPTSLDDHQGEDGGVDNWRDSMTRAQALATPLLDTRIPQRLDRGLSTFYVHMNTTTNHITTPARGRTC